MQTRKTYGNLVLDNLDIISLCTRYPRKEQLPKPKPNNQMISQVSMSRDGPTLRPRCSLSPSIARPIPWSILRRRSLAAGVTCRCTAAGNYRVVCGLLVVFLVGFGRPIHTSGSGAHCVWWSWRKGGLSWLLFKLSGNEWSRGVVFLSLIQSGGGGTLDPNIDIYFIVNASWCNIQGHYRNYFIDALVSVDMYGWFGIFRFYRDK